MKKIIALLILSTGILSQVALSQCSPGCAACEYEMGVPTCVGCTNLDLIDNRCVEFKPSEKIDGCALQFSPSYCPYCTTNFVRYTANIKIVDPLFPDRSRYSPRIRVEESCIKRPTSKSIDKCAWYSYDLGETIYTEINDMIVSYKEVRCDVCHGAVPSVDRKSCIDFDKVKEYEKANGLKISFDLKQGVVPKLDTYPWSITEKDHPWNVPTKQVIQEEDPRFKNCDLGFNLGEVIDGEMFICKKCNKGYTLSKRRCYPITNSDLEGCWYMDLSGLKCNRCDQENGFYMYLPGKCKPSNNWNNPFAQE